mmetsp:Transcript_101843/g.199747  ORF Transcript_101843/g.199747 Transcript_101843/m.199747 type:complete len:252 (-) Transcript_101843:148-903(-)
MARSRCPSCCTIFSKQLDTRLCCFTRWLMSGRSTNFSDLVQQFGRSAVARRSASRSCTLSPREWMFFRFRGSRKALVPQTRATSASKASSFQSEGEVQSRVSYVERAETILRPRMSGSKLGMNFAQLSSIQPLSAFVTRTTVPCCFARRSVSPAAAATWASCRRWASLTTQSISKVRFCKWSQVDGSIVSSQSKMKRVSSLVKYLAGAAAASTADDVSVSSSVSSLRSEPVVVGVVSSPESSSWLFATTAP